MEDALITLVVFGGIYYLIKIFTDYLLKRKLINTGNVDKTEILNTAPKNKEESSYPTLKWGLVALFAGLGLLVIAFLSKSDIINSYSRIFESYMSVGIELIAVSLGFLVYFLIARLSSK